jgi:hypothetical protein
MSGFEYARPTDDLMAEVAVTRCAICNGSIYVKSRDHGKRRASSTAARRTTSAAGRCAVTSFRRA